LTPEKARDCALSMGIVMSARRIIPREKGPVEEFSLPEPMDDAGLVLEQLTEFHKGRPHLAYDDTGCFVGDFGRFTTSHVSSDS